MAIARGRYRAAGIEPKVWFTSAESFARVLSDKNRALLGIIAAARPKSLKELAERTGRKKVQSFAHPQNDVALWPCRLEEG